MKKLVLTPEVIAAIVTVAGTLLVSIVLGFLEGRLEFGTLLALVAAILLILLLFLLYSRTGPRVTAGAGVAMLVTGFLVFLVIRPVFPTGEGTPAPDATTMATAVPSVEAAATPMPSPTSTPMSPPPASGTAPPTGMPALPPEPGATPLQVQTYALPLAEPRDVVYDGSDLWVLFEERLVKVELVEAEGRFRSAEQIDFPIVRSLTWDASSQAYWAASGAYRPAGDGIDLIDTGGNKTASYTIPAGFVGDPAYVAWDGEYLWATSDEGPLFKLQAPAEGMELSFIDSYAPSAGRFPDRAATGLAWDGHQTWLLVDDVLSKLDQAGQPVCQIPLPWGFPEPSWWGWRGLAWDGHSLWAAHEDANLLARVDPSDCC
jgi:hypothetical protein